MSPKRIFFASLLLSLYVVAGIADVSAAPIYIPGKSGGNNVTINLDPTMAGRIIEVYALAPKGEQSVEVGVAGVGGEIVTLQSFTKLGKQALAGAAARQTTPINLIRPDGKSVKQIKIINPDAQGGSSSSSSDGSDQGGDALCGCLTPDQISEYLLEYRMAFPSATQRQFCALFPPITTGCNFTPPTLPGSSSSSSDLGGGKFDSGASTLISAFLSYNSCLPAAAPGVVVKIDLTNVNPTKLTGKKLYVATKFHPYKGGRQATIKPKSDGRYSPQPLLLTATVEGLYYFGGDSVSMNHWRSKVRTGSENLDIVATIYYAANLLEIPMGGKLNGGKGTFDVTHGAEGYTFCATFSAQRQTWGDYGDFTAPPF